MPDLPAIIFDLDGTLIDSAPDIHATANTVFSNKGLQPFAFEVVRGFIGNGVGVLVSRLLQSQGLDGQGKLQKEIVLDFISKYEEAFDNTSVYTGVAEALTQLSTTGYPMAICTNKPAAPARAAVRHFGLDRHFSIVIGGDTLTERKPDPAPLRAAIAALGSPSAIFVGDSEVDAATARAADVPFALFTEGYRKAPADALGAKVLFGDYAALPQLISHISLRLCRKKPV